MKTIVFSSSYKIHHVDHQKKFNTFLKARRYSLDDQSKHQDCTQIMELYNGGNLK
jgi:hypothetical protein